MSAIIEVNYFNSYWLKRIVTGTQCKSFTDNTTDYQATEDNGTFTWPGPYDNGDAVTNVNSPTTSTEGCLGTLPATSPPSMFQNWFVEESRIRGGYNNVSTDLGVKAYLNEKNPVQKHRTNSLIYSGSFNSDTNFNETNVFPVGDSISKSLDPHNGSVQKLYAEDTNLIVFQEDKVSRALIDKDAIYSAEGGGSVTSTNLVIGQFVPYIGDFGISTNPESFAVYGFRKYFSDRNRNAIMRLSRDGLTEISNYGMVDWFRDNLSALPENDFEVSNTATVTGNSFISSSTNTYTFQVIDNNNLKTGSIVNYSTDQGVSYTPKGVISSIEPVTNTNLIQIVVVGEDADLTSFNNGDVIRFVSYASSRIIGGWDIYTKQYQLSLQSTPTSVDRNSNYSTLAYDEDVRGWTSFFSYKPELTSSLKNTYFSFYEGRLYQHNFPAQNNRSTFYSTRTPASVTFVFNAQPDLSKNFLTINYEGSSGWQCSSFLSDEQEPVPTYSLSGNIYTPNFGAQNYKTYFDETSSVLSVVEGAYDSSNPILYGVSIQTPPFYNAGFTVKENLYTANLISNSQPRAGEVLFNTDPLKAYPMSGIKANYATVTMEEDAATDQGGMKELFAVSTTFSKSGF